MDGKSVLLVVHGMGDAAQGSTLRTSVSKPLEAMRLRMRDKKTVRVEGGSDLRKIAKNDPDTRIVILAHSTGNLIVYEALAELRTNSGKLERKKELADTRVQDAASPGAVSTPEAREELKREAAEIGELLELERQTIKSIETWVSIGSVMSLAWSTGVVRESNPKYQRPIPTGEEIKWLNLWTTFDIATGAKLAPPDAAPTIPGADEPASQ